jgi:urease accessory protein
MFDAPLPELQRTRGTAWVGLSHGPRGTAIARLRQEGSAKAFLPRTDAADPEVVFLNTAGGLTGGDALSYRLDLAAGGRATATTQTAERIYRAASGTARVDVAMTVGAGAALDWLPQETILFEGAALMRETCIELAGDASCLMAETVVLGRAAMGETVTRAAFTDRRRVTRDGRPVMVEPLALDAACFAAPGPAGLDGARALATLALFAQGAEDALGPVRALLDEDGARAHASAWDGKLVVRAMARDAAPVRRVVARVAAHLRRAPMPRVWQI